MDMCPPKLKKKKKMYDYIVLFLYCFEQHNINHVGKITKFQIIKQCSIVDYVDIDGSIYDLNSL